MIYHITFFFNHKKIVKIRFVSYVVFKRPWKNWLYIVTMFDHYKQSNLRKVKTNMFSLENATILFSLTFCHNTWKTDKLWVCFPSMGAVPSVKVIDHKVLVVSHLNDLRNVVYSFYVCVWNAIVALCGFFMWGWCFII